MSGAVAVRRRARIEEVEAERERDEIRRRGEETAGGAWEGGGGGIGEWGTNADSSSSRPLKHECVTGFHARVTSEDDAEFERNQERERREREAFLGVVYAARADGKRSRMLIESSRVGGGGRGGGGVDDDDDDSRPARSSLWCDTPLGLSSDLYDPPPSTGLRITDGTTRAVVTRNNDGIIGRNGLFFQPMHRSLPTTGTAPPSGGTFLALENDEDHRREANNAKYDNLLMPPPPARLAVASSSRSVPRR